MIKDLSFEYSPLWMVPILLGAIVLVWTLYFSDKSLSNSKKLTLGVLRFLIFTLLGFLLLSPLLKLSTRITEKPILIWMEDRSSSMVSNADSLAIKTQFKKGNGEIIDKLEEKFDVRKLSFEGSIKEQGESSFSGKYTDLSSALNECAQSFYNQNVGSIVLLSDGIWNRGINPSYLAKAFPYPIHTIGFGDTSITKDAFIQRLLHNEITYLNNKFPLEIDVKARELKGEELKVVVRNRGKEKVYEEVLEVNSSDYFQKLNVLLSADSVGLNRFTVNIDAVEGESSTINNYQSFNVEVLDNRKQILILGSAPHPDMSSLSSALNGMEKYEVQTAIEQDYDFTADEPDLYILHSPEEKLINKLKKSTKPFWIIYGQNVNPINFKQFSGIKVGNHNSFEAVRAHVEEGFSLFKLNPELDDFIKRLPPLESPFGKMQLSGSNLPLFYKKVKRVETKELLWFFRDDENRRSAFLMANGIWQWRMYNYRKQQNFKLFDQLIASTVQYLTAKREDERFVVESKNEFEKEESIVLNARLYNKSLELTNDPVAKIAIYSEEGEAFEFDFSKLTNVYELDAGTMTAGNYTWLAKVSIDGEELSRRGAFSVRENTLEQNDLLARHELLKSLSKESNGNFYFPSELDGLSDSLLNNNSIKSIQRLETNVSTILNKKWIFFILLLLMASEWGLRKYYGKY